MKKLLCVFFLLPLLSVSQKDSTHRKKIGLQLSFPFEVGGSVALNNSGTDQRIEFLTGSPKSIGSRVQTVSAQIHFYDRIFIEYAYNFDNQPFHKSKALDKLWNNVPGYFVQEQVNNGSTGGKSYGSYSFNYSRVGLGGSIYLPYHLYLRPYICYSFGKSFFPNGSFAFKEYSSNRYFVREYTFEKLKTSGFHAGLTLCNHVESDKSTGSLIALLGIKVEYSEIHVKGNGIITQTEDFQSDIVTVVPVNKKFRYITIGIFLGLTGSRDKNHIKTSR